MIAWVEIIGICRGRCDTQWAIDGGEVMPDKPCYIPPRCRLGLPTLKKVVEKLGSAHEESKEVGSRYLGGCYIHVNIWQHVWSMVLTQACWY